MWHESWKTLACFIFFVCFKGILSLERRTLMRRERQQPRQWLPHGLHTATPSSHLLQPLQGPRHNLSLSALQRIGPNNPLLGLAGSVSMRNNLSNVELKHRKRMSLPPAAEKSAMFQQSLMAGTSGADEFLTGTALPPLTVTNPPGAWLMRQSDAQGPTTGAPAAATTGAAAGATTAAPGAAENSAASPAENSAASPAPSGGDSGGGISFDLLILIIAVVVIFLAAVLVRIFMSKKVPGRLGNVQDTPDSQYWKSAKARQNYRKSQMQLPKDGADSNSDQDAGASSNSSTYRDRRERNRRQSLSLTRDSGDNTADQDADGNVSSKSSAYKDRKERNRR
mmetsp:Transcript_16169/g.29103  ORF Transcript_16169/g.29103 Transcript_16169/m.29103 type:complete len:338 (+) Transcript_16169:145-1158(+)